MLSDAVYLQPSYEKGDYTNADKTVLVSGCGHLKLLSKERYVEKYPCGRRDWRILYVAKGNVHFRAGCRRNYTLGSGHLMLFRPFEAQMSLLQRQNHPEVYWLQLYGDSVAGLLDGLSLAGDSVSFVGVQAVYTTLFERLIAEMRVKGVGQHVLCTGIAMELLAEFGRGKATAPVLMADTELSIRRSMDEMCKNYKENCSVDEYAQRCNMSVGWFIRQFKAFTGRSPQQFIIGIRMNKARQLLEDTTFRVSEVSLQVGYDNPLYFSRLFKKTTGDSPSEYRARHSDKGGVR